MSICSIISASRMSVHHQSTLQSNEDLGGKKPEEEEENANVDWSWPTQDANRVCVSAALSPRTFHKKCLTSQKKSAVQKSTISLLFIPHFLCQQVTFPVAKARNNNHKIRLNPALFRGFINTHCVHNDINCCVMCERRLRGLEIFIINHRLLQSN